MELVAISSSRAAHKARMAARRFRQRAAVAGFTPSPRTGIKYRERDAKPAQRIEWLPNGGYKVLHPTRGWRVVSPKRIKAWGLTPNSAAA